MMGITTGLCALAFASSIQSSQAALLAYDSFGNYSLNTDLFSPSTQNYAGEVGFDTSVDWTNDNTSGPAALIEAGDLIYTNGGVTLASSGNQHLNLSGHNGGLRAVLQTPVTSGVIFYSVVVQDNTGGTNFAGITGNSGGGLDQTGQLTSNDVSGTDPHLFVVELDMANDTYNFWIDPTPGAAAPAVFKPSVASGSDTLAEVWLRAGGTNSFRFDELRVGETFEDVTPAMIPEPAVSMLSLFSLLYFVGLRRKRK